MNDIDQESYALVNEISICYQTFGQQTSPPLLLIMGLAAQQIHWDDNFCQQLADNGYWVIRFDNRDIGNSTKLENAKRPSMVSVLANQWFKRDLTAPYDLNDMATDAFGLLDHLQIKKCHLVGASMGGMIAQCMAILAPERVASLTSIMSTTGDRSLPKAKASVIAKIMKPVPKDEEGYVQHVLKMWRLLHGEHFEFDVARTEEFMRRARQRSFNPDGVWRQTCAIIASPDRTAMLEKLNVPSLVLHGDADPLVPVECGIATAKALPNCELKILKGMGHTLPRELWDEMIGAIAKLVNSVEAKREDPLDTPPKLQMEV